MSGTKSDVFINGKDKVEAMKDVEKVIKALNWTIKSSDVDKGIIRGKTKLTVASWGEDVLFFFKEDPNGTDVEIKAFSNQLIDWGMPRKRILQVERKIVEFDKGSASLTS